MVFIFVCLIKDSPDETMRNLPTISLFYKIDVSPQLNTDILFQDGGVSKKHSAKKTYFEALCPHFQDSDS